MNDLISREEMIRAIDSLSEDYISYYKLLMLICRLPSVEPEWKHGECTKINCPIQMNYISNDCDIKTCPYRTERKKGKWIYDGIRGRFPACKCSICGHYENADWALLQGVNYCPHCGAEMRGE